MAVVSFVRVGRICKPSESTNVFNESVVVQSNEPTPKPSS
jgi:hypothetical protein